MNRPAAPIRLHRLALSGHCHRVELMLSLLQLPYETVDVDLLKGEQHMPAFKALNAFGQVPVIQDGGVTLADSNAILVYLESRYATGRFLPRDPVGAAQVQRWLSAAAGWLAFGPAAARVIKLFGRSDDPVPAQQRAARLFDAMEVELGRTDWLAGREPTLADIALYSYTVSAPEGGVSLQPYPRIREWLARVEAMPRFLPMPRSPVGLAA
ncbi:glutathione S-transferase family protein [Ramlibacter humi]|uniref:Glutathione S-transferase family protein n=1 Tax=Ramlibacter humi TaxID=2530451 RepID=A0A4Z0BZ88_9BURK|nr:glutathione S-transferase [Ramlibacter humi]TFZ03618.1 glutathione S-transferase family protein [Ramlibacter humi]